MLGLEELQRVALASPTFIEAFLTKLGAMDQAPTEHVVKLVQSLAG